MPCRGRLAATSEVRNNYSKRSPNQSSSSAVLSSMARRRRIAPQTCIGIYPPPAQTQTMTATDFRAAIVDYVRAQAKPVDKFSHQERLYALTRQIGAGQAYDDDVVFAAAWMHDLGVFIGHRPEEPAALARWDSRAYAMDRVPQLLKDLRFPEAKIPAVVEVIREHLPSGNPDTLEGLIIRDVDILEQLGASGILRNVSKIGRDTRFQVFPEVLRVLQRNLETLPGQLRLPASRALAEPRVRVLKDFLEAATAEGCTLGPVNPAGKSQL